MKVGVSVVNITPPVGVPMAGYSAREDVSRGIHDDLYARAVVLDDGEASLALVSCDLLWLDREFVSETRRLIEAEVGISGGNIMISCTHTHSGPITNPIFPELMAWMEVLSRKIKGAVVAAHREMKEAKIGFNRGSVEGIVINRRRLSGPVDTEVGIIRVDDRENNPIALVVNYTCHPVVLGSDNLLISADYPCYVRRFAENNLGVTALFINGTCGDINPFDKLAAARLKRGENIYDRRTGTFDEAERLGSMIGAEAVKLFLETETEEDLELKAVRKNVKIPLSNLPSREEVENILKEKRQLFKKLVAERRGVPEMYKVTEEIRRAQSILKYIASGENARLTEVQAFKIGEDGLVGLPGEVFVEIGMSIKKQSGLEHTFVCGVTNDSIGYIPTREAFKESGYEVEYARRLYHTEEIGNIIEESALDALRNLTSAN